MSMKKQVPQLRGLLSLSKKWLCRFFDSLLLLRYLPNKSLWLPVRASVSTRTSSSIR